MLLKVQNYHDPTLTGASVAPDSQVCSAVWYCWQKLKKY